MKRCSRHEGVHIHGCPGCIADQRDRALLAMRKFAEVEHRCRTARQVPPGDQGYWWAVQARADAVDAFRAGDVEAALRAMGEESTP